MAGSSTQPLGAVAKAPNPARPVATKRPQDEADEREAKKIRTDSDAHKKHSDAPAARESPSPVKPKSPLFSATDDSENVEYSDNVILNIEKNLLMQTIIKGVANREACQRRLNEYHSRNPGSDVAKTVPNKKMLARYSIKILHKVAYALGMWPQLVEMHKASTDATPEHLKGFSDLF